MRLAAFEKEAHRLDCDKDDGQFHAVASQMGPAEPMPASPDRRQVNFTPGQPMIDATFPGRATALVSVRA